MNKRIVGIYSVIHFIVDLACAILVSNLVTQKIGQGTDLFIAILIYNFFAFAMQLPIGIIADKVNKNAICSAIGCLLVAIALFWLYNQIKDKVKNEKVIIPKINNTEIIAIVCLIFTFIVRGYVGLILSFEWKSNFILALISIFAVVFGKMIGGIIGDRIGFMKTSLISLIVSAFLFIFAFDNSVIGILAILFFNMTMPITLTALSNILFNNKGMAFGLLTVALFIGAVPVFFGYKEVIFNPVDLFATTIISAVILYVGIKKYFNTMEKKV